MNSPSDIAFDIDPSIGDSEIQPARISRITIERLYNLGSYEHVRYGLTVDLPGDCEIKASSAFVGAERILEALNPNRLKCCKTEIDLKREALRIQEAALMTDDKFQMQFSGYTGTRDEIMKRLLNAWQEDTDKRQAVIARAKNARQMLDDLGGSSQWKDAKLEWEDRNDED